MIDKVLPSAVWRVGPSSPYWKLFERLARQLRMQTQMRRPGSLRKGLAFLYGFFTGTVVSAEASSSGTAILECLRKQTPVSLREAYTAYRLRTAKGPPRPVSLGTVVRHLHLISLVFHRILGVCSASALSPSALFGLPDPCGGRRRRSSTRTDCSSMKTNTNTTTSTMSMRERFSVGSRQGGELAEAFATLAVDIRRDEHHEKVHTFSAAEVRTLYLACDTLFEKVLVTTLFTTGMRINAFCSLEWPPRAEPLDEVFGTEKGNVRMSFGVSSVLQRLLRMWMEQQRSHDTQRMYMFPSRDHPDIHLSTTTARRVFLRVAQRAGVVGAHVHPHTTQESIQKKWMPGCTRHTVAWTLYTTTLLPPLPAAATWLFAGIRQFRVPREALWKSSRACPESVAGFVGHRNTQVTSDTRDGYKKKEKKTSRCRIYRHVPVPT